MPRICAASWCRSDVSLVRFPLQNELRQKWIHFCQKEPSFQLSNHHRLCSRHFENEDFIRQSDKKQPILKSNAIPSVMVRGTSTQTDPVRIYPVRSEQQCIMPDENISISEEHEHRRRSHEDQETVLGRNDKCIVIVQTEREGRGTKRDYEEDDMDKELEHIKKKLKIEQQRVRRLVNQRNRLKELLEESRNKRIMSEDALLSMKGQFSDSMLDLIRNEMTNGEKLSKGRRYSKELKRFALSLHFHSPSAYNWMRDEGIHLPEERTLRNWRSGVECEAGFHTQALKALSNMSDTSKEPMYATLMVDAMAIRKQVTWNNSTRRFEGFEDLGDENDADTREPAAEALVFMAVGLNGHWKVPIGYFLINGISGEQQAALVREGLHHLHEAGINVVAFSCDGCGTNHKTAVYLGCNLIADQLRGTFPHPATKEPVVFLFDVVHMVKLMRNTLAKEEVIHIPTEEPGGEDKNIEWRYITRLHDIQSAEGLRLGNKLRKKHIEFESQKMKVSIAAQTLSNSVATAMDYMRVLAPEEFGDSESTSEWIKKIDRLFDLLNSRNPMAWNYKAPMKMTNEKKWRPFLTDMREMLLKITDSKGRRLATGAKKTAFIGLALAIDAVLHLADTLLATKKMRYLLTYKLSQDHLELFFCSVRGRGGWNNNPSVSHFKAAWRTLLLNNTIRMKKTGNCLAQDTTHLIDIVDVCHKRKNESLEGASLETPPDGLFQGLLTDEDLPDLTVLAENISCYISGYIVRQLNKTETCEDCKQALVETKPSSVADDDYRCFLHMKDNGGLIMPSRTVFLIGRKCERVFRATVGVGIEDEDIKEKGKILSQSNLLGRMEILTLRDLDTNICFPDLQSHIFDSELSISNHLNRLTRRVIRRYLTIRLHEYSKVYSETLKKSNIRKKLSKLVLFKNQ